MSIIARIGGDILKLHTIQLGMILVTATVLILFAHSWLAPDLVFSSMVAGLAGIVGSRIASNGYEDKKPPDSH